MWSEHLDLIRILKDELILAYSTASSESVLPRIIEKMEAYGAPASITSFVVPTGYSFNLDGSTLYQSIAAIFIAQLYGIDLSIWQEITGADPDGDLERDRRRAGRLLRGAAGHRVASGSRWKGLPLLPASTVSSIWRVPR